MEPFTELFRCTLYINWYGKEREKVTGLSEIEVSLASPFRTGESLNIYSTEQNLNVETILTQCKI